VTTARANAEAAHETTAPRSAVEPRSHAGVVVLGMHRSGTSAVAGLFRAAGMHVGVEADIMPATDDNPLGYHERLSLVEENDRLLTSAGATWEHPPLPGALATLRQQEAGGLARLLGKMLEEDEARPLLLKDPRISVLLPVWKPVYEGLLSPVLTVRHPLEIARSLFVRDGMPLAAGLALWEIYLTAVLDAYHEQPLTVAHIDELLAAPEAGIGLVECIRNVLDVSRTHGLDPQAASTAVVGSLRRQQAASAEDAEYLTTRQRELWCFLQALPTTCKSMNSPPELRAPSEAALATAEHLWRQRGRLAELEQHEAVFQPTNEALVEVRAELERAQSGTAALRVECDQRGQRIAELEREVAALKPDADRAVRAEAERDMLQARAAEALDQLRTQARMRAEERKEAQSVIEQTRQALDHWQSRAVELDEEIHAIRRSRTWRTGRVLLAPFRALRLRRSP
jgi:hypothetical protein